MSNDLLFSIIPREGKIPVVTDERVKRVSKEARAKQLSDDEKETHDEERLVTEQQQYKVHTKREHGREQHQSTPDDQHALSPKPQLTAEEESTYNSHGETDVHHHPDDDDVHHIDIYE